MISEALRLIRVFHDLKQKELAEKIGVSVSYISELENGNRNPSLDVIKKYSEHFEIPVSSIMFFSEEIGSDKDKSEREKQFIASKILNFLSFIENKTEAGGVR